MSKNQDFLSGKNKKNSQLNTYIFKVKLIFFFILMLKKIQPFQKQAKPFIYFFLTSTFSSVKLQGRKARNNKKKKKKKT